MAFMRSYSSPKAPGSGADSRFSIRYCTQLVAKLKILGQDLMALFVALGYLAISSLVSPGLLANSAQATENPRQNQPSTQGQQQRQYSIEPGKLSDVLAEFAAFSGVDLIFEVDQLVGLSSSGLQGLYTIEAGFAQLLTGTKLVVERNTEGQYRLKSRAEQTINLAPIRVIGSDPKRYEANLAKSVTGADAYLLETPRSIQVVTEQVILDQQVKDLRDILRNVSGVQARNISGGTTDAFLLRGVEVSNIFQDGFQLDANSSRIQAANIERVEVVKGPTAILSGQSQAGGIINIISKRPEVESRHFAAFNADDIGLRELLLDSTGKANSDGSLLYRLVGSVEDSETFRKTDDKAEIKRTLFAPSLTWQITSRDSLVVSAELISSELPFDNGTVLTQAADGSLGIAEARRTLRFGEAEDISDSTRRTLKLEYDHQFTNSWWLETDLGYQSADSNIRLTGANFGSATLMPGIPTTTALLLGAADINFNAVPEDGVLIRSPFETQAERERVQFVLRFSGDLDFASTHHRLTLGADYNRRHSDSVTDRAYISAAQAGFGTLPGLPALPGVYLADFNAFDINNPVFGQVDSSLRKTTQVDNTDTQIGLFINDNIKLTERWRALIGLRLDRFKRSGTNTSFFESIDPIPLLPGLESLAFNETESRLSRDREAQNEFSPNVGVLYQPVEQTSLFASYSESFVPQFVRNFLTGELIDSDPIESNQIEFGIKGGFLNDKLNFNLAYFDLSRENVPGTNDLLTGVPAFNDEEIRRGIELDSNVQFANGLSLVFNAAHLFEAEIKQGTNQGNRPSNVADNVVNLWVTYELIDGAWRGLGFGGGANHIGKRFVTDDNLFELEAYTTFDAAAFYYLPLGQQQQLRFQLGVKNLTDEEYHIPNNSTLGLGVGAPRTLYASLSWEL